MKRGFFNQSTHQNITTPNNTNQYAPITPDINLSTNIQQEPPMTNHHFNEELNDITRHLFDDFDAVAEYDFIYPQFLTPETHQEGNDELNPEARHLFDDFNTVAEYDFIYPQFEPALENNTPVAVPSNIQSPILTSEAHDKPSHNLMNDINVGELSIACTRLSLLHPSTLESSDSEENNDYINSNKRPRV